MIPRARRLRTKEVAEILRHGRTVPPGKYLSARILERKEDATIRAAAVVSKKVAHTAPERNRLRRALYDAIRTVISGTPRSDRPIRIIFFVRSIPVHPLRHAFAADIEKILNSLTS